MLSESPAFAIFVNLTIFQSSIAETNDAPIKKIPSMQKVKF